MYVTKAGSGGPPLFFVHGLACDATDWRAQVDAFAPRTTVAACDLPGHGASTAVPADCTIEAYGRAVARAVTELGLPPAILVGHSMGCRVVLAANRARPDAVAGLVLVDGSRIGAGDPEAAGQAMADELVGDGYLRFMRQFFESMFVPSSDPVVAQSIIDRALRFPAALGRPLLRNLATWDAAEVEGALDAVGVPVLAIQSTTMDTARERISLAAGLSSPWIDLVRAHVPRAAIELLAGTSHFPQIERADDVNAAIAQFTLDETVPTRGLAAEMRLGLHALGIGSGSERAVIEAVARAAEQQAFATLWSGEHVVMVDESASRYPYAADGKIAVPAVADWIDPMIGLSFAAAATTTIGIATGVLLLPEHNPVIVAKQAASLDKLSGGRFTLGIGIGWSREEFDALGIPFERRAARTADYVAAMRTIWRRDIASHTGEFANFTAIRVNPKPVRNGHIPVMLGGNSDAALRRVAQWGDGWYGFNLRDVDDAAVKLDTLQRLCREAGRDCGQLRLAVALRDPQPADAARLAGLGVDELVLVASPPEDPAQAAEWVRVLAAPWQ